MLVKSTVKYIQSLGQKKFRDEDRVFIGEGPKILNELLGETNTPVVNLYAEQDWLMANKDRLQQIDPAQIHEVKPFELERISFLTTPNQVLGIFKKPFFEQDTHEGMILLLDAIQDPGNMGTIIRTADWFGIRQIICSHQCVDPFHPKVIQSTMGSIARISVRYDDLKVVVDAHPGIPVYGAVLEGEDMRRVSIKGNAFLLIGNESKGISEELADRVQHKITIPKKGRAESLNAAMATGILLSHILT